MIKRIDEISNSCTGCMACRDVCPKGCISPAVREDGFRYAALSEEDCINCGRCAAVCPAVIQKKNDRGAHLYAAWAKDEKTRSGGSSGGVFELLARHFLSEGYAVCGAAFEGTVLKHRIIKSGEELAPLLKSKYVQSDTTGIYEKILSMVKNGEKVFFCGTPCQVSALVNVMPDSLVDSIITADIICHGVPSQKTFDMYIRTLEKKHEGRVGRFSFRVKDNKYRHAHGFSYTVYKNGKEKTENGIYLNSSFYNAFKKYLFFRESCYFCPYAAPERVSDITLGDFWGIEKWIDADTDRGVSLVMTNTDKGGDAFDAVKENVILKELPVEYGIESNYCLKNATKKPKNRDKIIESLNKKGYEATEKTYFCCSPAEKVYAMLPPKIRGLRKKIRKR